MTKAQAARRLREKAWAWVTCPPSRYADDRECLKLHKAMLRAAIAYAVAK